MSESWLETCRQAVLSSPEWNILSNKIHSILEGNNIITCDFMLYLVL